MEFNLATGVVVFKGDASQLDNDIMKSLKKSEELKKAIEGDGFKFKLYGMKLANDEMSKLSGRVKKMMNEVHGVSYSPAQQARQNRDENSIIKQEIADKRRQRRQLVASQNMQNRDETWLARRDRIEARNAQKVQERDENFIARRDRQDMLNQQKKRREASKQFGASAMIAAGASVAAGGAAIGAGASASLLAENTLKKSFELFSATVGTTFLPLVYEMSSALQKASRWWDELSTSVKGNIVEATKMIAITGVATVGFAALGKALLFISKNTLVILAGLATSLIIGQSMDGNKVADPGVGGRDERARKREGREWFQPDNPMLPDGRIGRWENGKAVPNKDEKVGARKDDITLGIRGPASFTQASELLRSIQLAAAGKSELQSEIDRKQAMGDLKFIADGVGKMLKLERAVGD